MARVLIFEPHEDISALLELVVSRLGHEPVVSRAKAPEHGSVDAAVIEPGNPDGVRLARTLRAQNVPLLFTSIYPPSDDLLELRPAAYLIKPFPIDALERALGDALSHDARTPAA